MPSTRWIVRTIAASVRTGASAAGKAALWNREYSRVQATAKKQQGDHQQDDPVDSTATANECRNENDR